MTVKDRIRDYIKHKGISERKFSMSIGVSPTYISSMRKSLQPDKMNRIVEKYPDLNLQWLMTGEGEMLRNSHVDELNVFENDTFADVNSLNPDFMNVFNEMMKVITEQSSHIGSLISQHDRLITEVERSGLRADKMIDFLQSSQGVGEITPKKEAM